MDRSIRDFRNGFRALARTPGFTAVVVLTLGLGIGASVTTLSVMQAVLWRPLPYPEADRLVLLNAETNKRPANGLSGLEMREIEAQSRTIDDVAPVSGVSANLNIDGELERVFAVSANNAALVMLGAEPPALGRLLRDNDDIGADGFVSAVVISDGLWRRHFGADPAAVGRHIQVNNLDVQIAGVLRPGLRVYLPAASNAAEDVDVWFPSPRNDGPERHPATLARLAPDASIAQAQAELAALSAGLVAARQANYPDGLRLTISPLQDRLTARVKPALLALGIAVAFVLLISCVNVTNLMLARAKSREREIAVRASLGARRGHVIAQLLSESVILAAAGGLVGLALGVGGVGLLDWLRPTHLPRQSQIGIDGTVAAFAVAISAVVCLAFGLVPALRVTRKEQLDPLKTGRSGTSAPGIRRLQRGLVIAEVALSIVPLVAGGLMLRSFWSLNQTPIGFDPDGLQTARVQYSFRSFPDLARRWGLYEKAIAGVKDLPGVEAVSAAGPLPFSNLVSTFRYSREGDPSSELVASQQSIAPGYLALTRTRLKEGRDVSADDIRLDRKVAIVDDRVAARLWPGGAVGRALTVKQGSKPVTMAVIGVTEPVRATRVSDADMPHVFVSYNVYQLEMSLVVKTAQTAGTLGPDLRRVVEALGTGRPVIDIRPMRDYVDLSMGDTRFTMLMLTAFAAASLLLAGIGMYGTLAYLISQRTQEFGVRMALGATPGNVVSLVAREGAVLTLIGGIVGLMAALGLAGGLRGLLYGVAPTDATTITAVIALIGLVSLAAAGLPAWRASRVDPSTALRSE